MPPIMFQTMRGFSKTASNRISKGKTEGQELDIYWTEDMANQLENWGKDHTWNEIECLLVNCKGKILDIACGTGVNILSLSRFKNLELYGFDISDYLINKAIDKGIDPEKLRIADATATKYLDGEFDYSYSIGSLEHFTEDGIDLFLSECSRYTKIASLHMIPVSETNVNEGWLRTNQSFHNNSIEWWLTHYSKHFKKLEVINSGYKDPGLSLGKWFICYK